MGGDEFAVILPDAGRDVAAQVGRRAADTIERVAHRPGVSFGIAVRPDDGREADALLRVSDDAMYAAKRHPGGAPSASPRPDAGPRTRLAVAARLATQLAPLDDPRAVAQAAVTTLHEAFGSSSPSSNGSTTTASCVSSPPPARWRATWTSSPTSNPYMKASTAALRAPAASRSSPTPGRDPDYLRRDPRSDPGSELSLPIVCGGAIWGVLNLEQLATHAFGEDDVLLADPVATQVGAALHRCRLTDELESSFAATLGVLADALETKDAYTAEHAERVADLAVVAGRSLALDPAELKSLRYCALLHDIGKIGIRSDLLAKPGRLTPEEFEEIKEHAAIGASLLQRIPLLAHVAPLVRAVHERYDGAGYPDGLAGEAIPPAARIVAVCDACTR